MYSVVVNLADPPAFGFLTEDRSLTRYLSDSGLCAARGGAYTSTAMATQYGPTSRWR